MEQHCLFYIYYHIVALQMHAKASNPLSLVPVWKYYPSLTTLTLGGILWAHLIHPFFEWQKVFILSVVPNYQRKSHITVRRYEVGRGSYSRGNFGHREIVGIIVSLFTQNGVGRTIPAQQIGVRVWDSLDCTWRSLRAPNHDCPLPAIYRRFSQGV